MNKFIKINSASKDGFVREVTLNVDSICYVLVTENYDDCIISLVNGQELVIDQPYEEVSELIMSFKAE